MDTTKLSGWTRVGYIVLGILYAVTGMYLFMYPAINTYTLGLVISISLIVYGIFKIVSYFTYGEMRSFFRYNLIVGIVMTIFGLIMWMNIGAGMQFLGIMMGIMLLVDAALTIYFSLIVREVTKYWWLILISSILVGICGCYFLFNPADSGVLLTSFVGAYFLVQGIQQIFVGIFAL